MFGVGYEELLVFVGVVVAIMLIVKIVSDFETRGVTKVTGLSLLP